MGRRRLEVVEFISDDRLRQITYCKRKKGLLKKAMELSILCGIPVQLIIGIDGDNKVINYESERAAELHKRSQNPKLIKESFNNRDVTLIVFNLISIHAFTSKSAASRMTRNQAPPPAASVRVKTHQRRRSLKRGSSKL